MISLKNTYDCLKSWKWTVVNTKINLLTSILHLFWWQNGWQMNTPTRWENTRNTSKLKVGSWKNTIFISWLFSDAKLSPKGKILKFSLSDSKLKTNRNSKSSLFRSWNQKICIKDIQLESIHSQWSLLLNHTTSGLHYIFITNVCGIIANMCVCFIHWIHPSCQLKYQYLDILLPNVCFGISSRALTWHIQTYSFVHSLTRVINGWLK